MRITVKKSGQPFDDKDAELWEDGTLGDSVEHAQAASAELELALDEGLGLEMISMRLQKKLIEDLKKIAKSEGIGYQPLIRQILTKYARRRLTALKTTAPSTGFDYNVAGYYGADQKRGKKAAVVVKDGAAAKSSKKRKI